MARRWHDAAKARNAFCDLIESLSPEQLRGQTLAGSWTPHHLLAHMVFIAEMKIGSFLFSMLKAGFNYDKMADVKARYLARRPASELVSRLRDGAANPAPMPRFPEMAPVGDALIHLQDIRRAQDIAGDLDPELLSIALDLVTTHSIGRGLANIAGRDDVTWRATDLDWSHGSGPEVLAPGESILMFLAGRAGVDELSGPGVRALG